MFSWFLIFSFPFTGTRANANKEIQGWLWVISAGAPSESQDIDATQSEKIQIVAQLKYDEPYIIFSSYEWCISLAHQTRYKQTAGLKDYYSNMVVGFFRGIRET